MSEMPPYTRMEYERKFLVDPASNWKSFAKPYSRRIVDRYLSCGRLRLRTMSNLDDGRVIYKLTKKFESPSLRHQPVVNIYLSPPEYQALLAPDGHDLSKTRHHHEYQGRVFSIDLFEAALDGLILCETEAASSEELSALRFPAFVTMEVTDDAFFTGGNLARTSRAELLAHATLRPLAIADPF